MEDTLPVRLTSVAVADLDRGWEWCRARDPAAADVWKQGLQAAVMSLALMPERCPPAPEAEGLGQQVLALVFGRLLRCRVLFRIAQDGVTVLTIRHDATA